MMEFTVKKSDMIYHLRFLSKGVAGNPIKPVLKGILFELNNGLKMTATDMEFTVISKIPTVFGDGSFVVDAKTVYEIVKNLPNDDINFSLDGDKLKISSGRSKFTIFTQNAEDFPELRVPSDGAVYEMDRVKLAGMIDRVSFSAATDTNMRNLNGVYFEMENGIFRTVAVDGFRMAVAKEEIENDRNLGFLLPLKAIKELSKMLNSSKSEEITMRFENRLVAFEDENITLVCKTIDTDFPNYKRVIPEEFKTRVVVDRKGLRGAVRRASIVTKAGTEAVKFTIEESTLKVSSKNAAVGEAEETLEVQMEGEPMVLAFNPTFVLDALNHTDEEKVQLNFAGENKPLMIDAPDRGYFFIVMPVRM
jgi:DNA polymerase-3 subunit beta